MNFIVVSTLFSVVAVLAWKLVKRPNGYPPGPRGFPLLGVAPQLALKIWGKSAHESFAALSSKYGPVIGVYAGPIPLIVINGYEASKLAFQSGDLSGRPDALTFRIRAFGKRLGILFNDGEDWHVQRSFALRHLRDLGLGKTWYESFIQEEINCVMDQLKQKAKDSPKFSISLKETLSISVLNVLWALVAGQRYPPDDERLGHLLQLVQRVLRKGRNLIQIFPFLKDVAPRLSGYNEIQSRLSALHNFVTSMISEHEEYSQQKDVKDFVDIYLEKIRENSEDRKFTREELIVTCLDLFEAGSETTTSTLETAFLYVVHHPDVLRKLRGVLDDTVGAAESPSLSQRKELGYVEAVLCEVMRISGVTPLTIPHRAMRNTQLLGYAIPNDAMVLINLWSIHHDPNLWKDPHKFHPERFLDQDGYLKKPDYFLPFGSGKRACLGELLARNTLFLYFSSLIHSFDLTIDGELPDLEPQLGVTLSTKPFRVKLTPRLY